MTGMASFKSTRHSAISWLNAILRERLSTQLMLSKCEQGYLLITVSGSAVAIRFDSEFAAFSQTGYDFPCGIWDPEAEGWRSALGSPLPAPGATSLPSPLIKKSDCGYVIHYDILGLVYWMLSRQEEVGRVDLDKHGRFPARSSHAYKHGYLERPIVDEWLAILAQVVERAWPQLALAKPEFSVRVSHDVDTPARYGFSSVGRLLRTMAGDILRRHEVLEALRAPLIWSQSKEKLHKADPFNTFNWIMSASERYEIKSAFYFISGRTLPARDARYDIKHPAIRELMRGIHGRGHEIGLHPSYNTYQRPDIIASEARALINTCREEGIKQATWGGRMHYLRWQTPATLYGWEQAGMAYDSTLTYAERPGFRCGTCHEYPAFDPVAGKALQLRIRPLIAMECTVLAPRYMNLGSGDIALKKFIQLKQSCRAVNGNFTLLWHNTLLERHQQRTLYEHVLAA